MRMMSESDISSNGNIEAQNSGQLNGSKRFEWIPTHKIIPGTVIRAFLPLKKCPELVLTSNDYADLYPGDEVFVVEQTKDGKWCRGYVSNDLMPMDFISNMNSDSEELPKQKIQLLIFPRRFVHLDFDKRIEDYEFLRFPTEEEYEQGNESQAAKLPSLYRLMKTSKTSRSTRPAYPYHVANSYSLNREILLSLFILTKHIYYLYSFGAFEVVEQMSKLYYKLDAERIRLQEQFMTSTERSAIIKSVLALMSKIPKLIASQALTKKAGTVRKSEALDPAGYRGVLTRNEETGELLTNSVSPQHMAASTSLYALTTNYPVSNVNDLKLKPDVNNKFHSFPPSQILVDCHEIIGKLISDQKSQDLVAYLYLRTAKEVLTESFIIDLKTIKNNSFETVSSVLFRNLPYNICENNKVYLAVEIIENTKVILDENGEQKIIKPFVPFHGAANDSVQVIRRGVVAGATDITRVFSKGKGSLASGYAYNFKVELLASFYTNKAGEPEDTPVDLSDPQKIANLMKNKNKISNKNNGWGDLIDRIINDSHTGIAVTSQIESVLVSVKEIKSDCNFLQTSVANSTAITTVYPQFYDTLSSSQSDRIYMTLDKVTLYGIESHKTNISNITIQVSSNNENVTFRRSGVDNYYKRWSFVSIRPGELVNETIRIDGIDSMSKEETLRVSAYLNGRLLAKSRFYVKKGRQILEYKRKSVFQLISSLSKPLVEIEVGTTYIGTNFNMDKTLHGLISLLRKNKFSEEEFEPKTIELLKALKMVPLTQVTKYFGSTLLTLLELLHYICYVNKARYSEELKKAIFTALVQFLDMNIARHDNCKHLFNDFVEEIERENVKYFPELGPTLVNMMSQQFNSSKESWTYVGRALCRSYVLILRLSRLFSKDFVGYHEEVDAFFSSLCVFFSVTNDSVLVDQVAILESYDLAINESSAIFDDTHLIQLISMLFDACQKKEDATQFGQSDQSSKEKRFVNAKFLLLRRIIQCSNLSSFFQDSTENATRLNFLNQVIGWCFQPLIKHNETLPDLTSVSFANGVLISIIEGCEDAVFKRNLLRLLPVFCRAFLFLRRTCGKQDKFRFKRVFNPLFPTFYPLAEITVDSMVTHEIVVEVLLEMTTIIIALTSIAETLYGSNASFINIIDECKDDEHFQSPLFIKKIVREDLISIFSTISRLIKGDFYPSKKWYTFTAATMRACMTLAEMCLDVLRIYYIPEESSTIENFDQIVWGRYAKIVLSIANHKTVNSTALNPLARKALYLIGDDLIGRSAHVFDQIWELLGNDTSVFDIESKYGIKRCSNYQLTLLLGTMDMVSDFFVFSLLRHAEARKVGSKVIWTTLVLIWIKEDTLTAAIEELTPQFFNAYQKGALKPSVLEVELFLDSLLYTIHLDVNDRMKDSLFDYIRILRDFLTAMAETEEIPSGPEFDDDRTANQLQIFGYLMSMNKPEMLHTLVNDLFISYMRRKDYIQAALSLELLALTYDWNPNDSLPATKYPPLPQQSSFERREYLYKEAARNFTKGLKLEKALTVYKDLAEAYDKINYDLDGLSFVHGQISNIYTDLQNVDRLVPSYFKVSFYGFGFPKNLRGKTYIFEGLPFEHITSIHNRLLKLYPGSKLVNSFTEADRLLVSPPNGKYIHVISVEPKLEISDEYATSEKKNDINNKVRSYVENRNLRTFSSSRKVAGTQGITDLWVIEYIFETKSTFPTLMNRSEVVNIDEKRLSPISNAIKSLQQKIQELSGLEDMCYKLIKENGDCSEIFSELSRNISGTIDAPINGGIAEYRVFYTDEETRSKLQESDVELLIAAFNELTIVLNRCLALHGQLCPPSLTKSHTVLQELFIRNFEREIQACNINVNQTKEETHSRIKQIQSTQSSFSKRNTMLMTPSIISASHSIRSSGSNGSAARASMPETSASYSLRSSKSNAISHTLSHATSQATSQTPSQAPSQSTRIMRPKSHINALRMNR